MSKKKTDGKPEKDIINEEAQTDVSSDTVDEKVCEKDYGKLLEDKERELSEITDRYKRLMAEYDNFKKRTVKEKEDIYSSSVKDTVSELLPVIDNLERAIDSFEDKESEHCKGVQMVLKQTDEIFKKLGVNEIKAVGEQFNPELHNAVMHVDDDTIDENTVVEEFMKGYTYKDKVIRHSMVKVAN